MMPSSNNIIVFETYLGYYPVISQSRVKMFVDGEGRERKRKKRQTFEVGILGRHHRPVPALWLVDNGLDQ